MPKDLTRQMFIVVLTKITTEKAETTSMFHLHRETYEKLHCRKILHDVGTLGSETWLLKLLF